MSHEERESVIQRVVQALQNEFWAAWTFFGAAETGSSTSARLGTHVDKE